MEIEVVSLKIVKEKKVEIEVNGAISDPYDASKIIAGLVGDKDREHLVTLCLNTKNKVNYAEITSMGSLNASIVHPREVFKTLILSNSCSFIVGHNHPSGDCTPSQEDVKITKRLEECGKILGIELLDHIIVNSNGEYISLKEKGLL